MGMYFSQFKHATVCMAHMFLKEKNQSFYGVCRVNQTQPHLIDEE